MNLAGFAVNYRAIVLTTVALLVSWGIISFFTMPRREDPEFTIRTCAVTTIWTGAPTEKVEELITKPLEEAIDTIEEVDTIRSTTSLGISTIYVDADDTVPTAQIQEVWDKVRSRVQRVKMPADGVKPDVNDEFGDTSILLLAIYQKPLPGEKDVREEYRYSFRKLEIIADEIKDQLRLLPGVAKAMTIGARQERVYIETTMENWSQIKLSTNQLRNLLEARNIVLPGGDIDTSVGRFSIKPGGEFNTVAEIEKITVGTVGKGSDRRPVYLKDLGLSVKRSYEDPPGLICRYGDPHTSATSIIVAITMKSGSNIVDICTAAKERVRRLQDIEQSVPPDIGITPISDQSENVAKKISDVIGNLIGAIVIVIIVVWLVVGFRTATVMATNIPIVVLAAIALVTIFDVQLEQISLASIIIALGLLVDNAVQVCDQSRTNQLAGMAPEPATVSGANMLAISMLTGTATTVAAFFPMLIGLQGSSKEYVYSLPVTLSVTLGISWVLAMTFCVLLASRFIRVPKDPNKPGSPLAWLAAKIQSFKPATDEDKKDKQNIVDKLFHLVSTNAINAKFITIGIAAALLFGAFLLPVGSEFFPQDNRDQFAIQIFLPENATIKQTDRVAKNVEAILRKLSPTTVDGKRVQRLRAMRTLVGGGGSRWYLSWNPEPRKPNYAEILVRTTDPQFTSWLAAKVREISEKGDPSLGFTAIAGARIIPRELMLGPSEDPINLRVMGTGFANRKVLRDIAERVKTMVRNEAGTWDINDSWGVTGYQILVDIDEDKANTAGVTNADVARTLNAYFSGFHLTTFREGDHLVPVFLRLPSKERKDLDGLQTAFIEGATKKVPLDSIASFRQLWQPIFIQRRDLNRVIEVRSQVEPGFLGNDIVKKIMRSDEMAKLQSELPSGYWIEVGGALESSNDGIEQMGVSLGISILLIILILVVQYNGWAKPLIIMTTLPMALIGALPGLWLTGNPLGFMPQLGILSLFGIVLNAAIIFIDFADLIIQKKIDESDGSGPICGLTRKEFRECLVETGKQRLLPIFLTTATTIGGLLPLALVGGPLWEGMAWCMIFGLAVGTLLTLLVVPALYAVFVENFGVKPIHISQQTQST